MATCKDCLHIELCQYNTYQEAHYFGKDKKIYITIKNNSVCKFFKPATDVVEVKHGEWIYNTDDFTPKMRCTVCGYNKPMIAGESIQQEPNNYCNNCGADMRGERNDL